MSKHEKPQKSNPNKLTIKQHVLPVMNIRRFANPSGRVSLHDVARGITRSAKPTDDIFCARRAWDQRAEVGYMKAIEDAFQGLVAPILEGTKIDIQDADAVTASNFYALWYMRSRRRELPDQEIQLQGISGGSGLTKNEEEVVESKGGIFARADGKMPARHINGIRLQMELYQYSDQIRADSQWGIIYAQEGEFLVPDMPHHNILPISPIMCLAIGPTGMIDRNNVAEINRALVSTSQRYYFARDFAQCPL